MKPLLQGFVLTTIALVILVLLAWGAIELAAYLWRLLSSVSPLAGVVAGCGMTSIGLAALERVAAWLGL